MSVFIRTFFPVKKNPKIILDFPSRHAQRLCTRLTEQSTHHQHYIILAEFHYICVQDMGKNLTVVIRRSSIIEMFENL